MTNVMDSNTAERYALVTKIQNGLTNCRSTEIRLNGAFIIGVSEISLTAPFRRYVSLEADEVNGCIGVYANGDRVYNAVKREDLKDNIRYNLQMRFGRGYFVHGVCIYQGFLTSDQVTEIERELLIKPYCPTKASNTYN